MINSDYLSPGKYLPNEVLSCLAKEYLSCMDVFNMMSLNKAFSCFIKNDNLLYLKKIVPLKCISQAKEILNKMINDEHNIRDIDAAKFSLILSLLKYDFNQAEMLAGSISDIRTMSRAYLNLVNAQAKFNPVEAKKTAVNIKVQEFKDEALSEISFQAGLKESIYRKNLETIKDTKYQTKIQKKLDSVIAAKEEALNEIDDDDIKKNVDRKLLALLVGKDQALELLSKISDKQESDLFRLELVRLKKNSDYGFVEKIAEEISSPELKISAFIELTRKDPEKIDKAKKMARELRDPIARVDYLMMIANLDKNFEEAKIALENPNLRTLFKIFKLRFIILIQAKSNLKEAEQSFIKLKELVQVDYQETSADRTKSYLYQPQIAILSNLAKIDLVAAQQYASNIEDEELKSQALINLSLCKIPFNFNEAIRIALSQPEYKKQIDGLLQII